jgi:diacylglycerol kinase (ATP)
MNKPDNTGIRRILRAAAYSAQGFSHAVKHEAAFRQELGSAAVFTSLVIVVLIWGGVAWQRFAT